MRRRNLIANQNVGLLKKKNRELVEVELKKFQDIKKLGIERLVKR